MTLLTSNWIIFFPLACTLFVAQRMTKASDKNQEAWSMVLLRSMILMMLWFSFLGFIMRWNVVSMFWLAFLPVPILILLLRRRALERVALLATLQMPRTEGERAALLENLSQEKNAYFRKKAKRLIGAAGGSWGWLLEFSGIAKSFSEKIALRLQHAYGISPVEWEQNLDQEKTSSVAKIDRQVNRLLGSLLVLLWSIPGLVLMYIVLVSAIPRTRQILVEFDEPPPETFLTMVSDYFESTLYQGYWMLWLVVPMSMILVVYLCVGLWMFPGWLQIRAMRWICDGYFQALGLSTFSFVLSREANLQRACEQTAEVLPIQHTGERFSKAHQLMEQGTEFSTAFRRAGLVSSAESKTLAEADQPQLAVQQLAHWRVERLLARYSIAVQVIILVTTFVWGIVVARLGYVLVDSLVKMTEVARQW